ncbi:alpha/beta fold hydrolase [Actinokineospora sp. UTMC 2448]|uniref:alpha/beta fold hydrolase n=1 Tax=Actinokineospora sp. UTMC 2448 TaxID=2268449 RepID=UPI002164B891|nr:alpha/beta hydrolase [Actinokineospora sp. UTMC 2448]UVS80762.1 acetoin dehydrogenase E2 subunit dihydrolipoyllysine-residue acetyltransferase [Actinokineospora sp. UTMC 2448]
MTGFPEVHHPAAGRPVVMLHGGNVGNWMWEPQLPALTDRMVLTPDLPGFGARVGEDWPGLDAAADDVVARVTAHVEGPFDLVGLSLGAVTALRLLARHPDRVRSAFLTGAPLTRAGVGLRLICQVHLAFCQMPWFWRGQAAAFGIPADARAQYVAHGLSVRRETAAAMNAEVCAGGVPADLGRYTGPLLAIAGQKESAAVRRSLADIAKGAPQSILRLAPGMHHIWNIEDTALFNDALRAWLAGTADPRLLPVEPRTADRHAS